jgi:hypothetical protein
MKKTTKKLKIKTSCMPTTPIDIPCTTMVF